MKSDRVNHGAELDDVGRNFIKLAGVGRADHQEGRNQGFRIGFTDCARHLLKAAASGVGDTGSFGKESIFVFHFHARIIDERDYLFADVSALVAGQQTEVDIRRRPPWGSRCL